MQQRRTYRGLAGAQPWLDQFEVPVAQLAIDEAVERERGVREVVAVDPGGDLVLGALEPREDPPILDRRGLDRRPRVVADPEQDQPRGVPQLVCELEALRDPLLAEAHVLR